MKGTIKPGAMPFLHRYLGNPVLTAILNIQGIAQKPSITLRR